jgi:hypothetical protein
MKVCVVLSVQMCMWMCLCVYMLLDAEVIMCEVAAVHVSFMGTPRLEIQFWK